MWWWRIALGDATAPAEDEAAPRADADAPEPSARQRALDAILAARRAARAVGASASLQESPLLALGVVPARGHRRTPSLVGGGADAFLSVVDCDDDADGEAAMDGDGSDDGSGAAPPARRGGAARRAAFGGAAGKAGVGDIAVRPDARVVASAGWDHRVRLWAAPRRARGHAPPDETSAAESALKPLAVLRFHTESVAALAWSADSAMLASASKDTHIAIWRVFPPGDG